MNQKTSILRISNIKLIALSVIYLIPFITTTLVQKFGNLSGATSLTLNTITTLVQAPLMLVILVTFTENSVINKLIGLTITLLLAYSSVALAVGGINEANLLRILLVGSVPVMLFSTRLFVEFVKMSVYENREGNKAFMLSGIVFGFGSYVLLLSMNMMNPGKHGEDIRILLGMVTLISTFVISLSLALSKVEYQVMAPAVPLSSAPSYNAGYAQWEDFTLTNTPEVLKKGVTDISKYYQLSKSS